MAGNQIVDKVTENAVRICHWAGIHGVPVFRGQHKPLMRDAPILCPEIHGDSGLDGPLGGPCLPPAPISSCAQPGKAVTMFNIIAAAHSMQHGKVQLVATGALTNVALLISLYPEVGDMIDIVIMGGSLGLGNTGPVVEFNIQTDPEAAKMVFEAGIKLTMVPLEVTHTALATPGVLQQIRALNTESHFLGLMMELLTYFAKTYKASVRVRAGALRFKD